MGVSAAVRNLFAGSALSTPPEDDDEDARAANDVQGKGDKSGPSATQVDALVASESDKARKAESERWSKVMSSDEGSKNPKGAARLLTMANGAASADDVIAALADMPAAAAEREGAAANAGREKQLADDKAALENDEDANPNTGGAAGRPGARTGEGEAADRGARRESRAARIQKRNPRQRGAKSNG